MEFKYNYWTQPKEHQRNLLFNQIELLLHYKPPQKIPQEKKNELNSLDVKV